jgi:hypothetical protein
MAPLRWVFGAVDLFPMEQKNDVDFLILLKKVGRNGPVTRLRIQHRQWKSALVANTLPGPLKR